MGLRANHLHAYIVPHTAGNTTPGTLIGCRQKGQIPRVGGHPLSPHAPTTRHTTSVGRSQANFIDPWPAWSPGLWCLGLASVGRGPGPGLGRPGGLKFTFENPGLIFKSKFRSLALLGLLPGPGLGWASPAFAAGLCWEGSVGWGLALAGGPGLGWPGSLKFTFENQGLIFKSNFRSLAGLVSWALLSGPGPGPGPRNLASRGRRQRPGLPTPRPRQQSPEDQAGQGSKFTFEN